MNTQDSNRKDFEKGFIGVIKLATLKVNNNNDQLLNKARALVARIGRAFTKDDFSCSV